MIRLKDILREGIEERDSAMVSGVADIISRVKDSDNRKDIAMKMLTKFDTEGVKYDKDSFLKLCGVTTNEELKEVGDNDTNLKRIMRVWDMEPSFTKKKIGVVVMGNPNATREKVYDALRDMDYKEITQVLKDLRRWQESVNEEEICEDCWKGYTAIGMKKGKDGKPVPNCVPKNEDTLPMLQKPTKPTKPKISKPKYGGTKPSPTKQDRIKRATVKLDVAKKNLSVASTPRQKTQIQRRIQKQQQRLTKMKQDAATKK
jgi:hypothetical protein